MSDRIQQDHSAPERDAEDRIAFDASEICFVCKVKTPGDPCHRCGIKNPIIGRIMAQGRTCRICDAGPGQLCEC